MQYLIVICFLAITSFAVAEKYTDRYDNINVQEILDNKRLLEAYVACILDKGKCTPEGRELKSHIKEALENDCEKCTDVQRDRTKTVISHLINYEPGYWDELVAKYDPQHKYTTKYEKELKSIKA